MSSTEGPYAAEVTTGSDPVFYGNALRFPTADAARAYAEDLFCRWTAVRTWRVVTPCGWGRATTVVAVKS